MVWAISILCVSLSCEPVPQMLGWYFSERDCTDAALMITQSWQPEIGFYRIECVTRSVI